MQRRNLVLPELILNVLFFALAAGILVQVFALAYADGLKNRVKTEAMLQVQNVVEQVKANPYSAETALLAAGFTNGDGRIFCSYDAEWNAAKNGRYEISLALRQTPVEAGVLFDVTVACTDREQEETMASLSTSVYERGAGQ